MLERPVLTLILFAVVATPACAGDGLVTPVYDRATRALLRLDYDYDANGTIDVRTYMRNGRPFRLEGDVNGDGTPDRWEYYDVSGQLERIGSSTRADGHEDSWAHAVGSDVRLDLSTERDGVVDRHEYYAANVLLRTDTDTNHDGRPDLWEEYTGGRLAMVLVDEDKSHGAPTRRIVYATGAAPRIEIADREGHFVPIAAPLANSGKESLHGTR